MSFAANNLLIGTNNEGKVREIREMLGGLAIDLCYLGRIPNIIEVDETGSTFAENARLKAVGYAAQSGLVTLADDSGLEVEALDGRPGVLSARYGGEETSFDEKIGLLLAEAAAAGGGLDASFICAICIASPDGTILAETEGVCRGQLASAPRGSAGFGYDPIFIPDGFDKTFAELSGEQKAQMSHRGRAFSQIIPFLRGFSAY